MIVVSQTGSDTMPRLTWRGIADDLAARIQAGEYQPDDQLVFEDLAELYDVSRSTIQRAMNRLDALGLAGFQPGRGWFVVHPSE